MYYNHSPSSNRITQLVHNFSIPLSQGFRNDFQEAMEQVDQAYLDEMLEASEDVKSNSKTENRNQDPTITYEEVQEMAKSMGRGNREHDMTVIVHFTTVSP